MKKLVSVILLAAVAAWIFVPLKVSAIESGAAAGTVSVSWGSLNVRAESSTGSKVVASLKKGDTVALISKSGQWWQVEYARNKYGWCHGNYISPISQSYAAFVSTDRYSLNVRSGPGTGYAVTDSLAKGENIVVLSEKNGWCRVLYSGTKTGWASAGYITAESRQSKGAKYSAVSLAVPAYSQTDPRWASVKIGSSGKTMAEIGCVTTSIAMVESWLTGRTVFPDAMAKRLSYTPGGSVYWPENYTAVTYTSNWLEGVYAELLKGRPVVLGAKNSSGGQHWVVVTGYSGGNSLTPSGFYINDPGSSQRVNLGQFFEAYPYFYKYFRCR